MTIGIAIAALSACAVFSILAYVLLRRSASGRRSRTASTGATALESRETFLVGIDQDSASGENRQKLIRQCRPLESVKLVREGDHDSDRAAIVVQRNDGSDIGQLPRKLAIDIAEYLDSGTPVKAKIRAIEPCENDRGQLLSGVRLEITPYRIG